MSQHQELLPCPFCGGPADLYDEQDTIKWISCEGKRCITLDSREGCLELGIPHETTAELVLRWNTRRVPTREPKISQARLFSQLVTLDQVKRASAVGEVQFHLLAKGGLVPDPLQGQSAEHDRLTAAFTEVHYLDLRAKAEAAEILTRHGLEGFEVTLHVTCADSSTKT